MSCEAVQVILREELNIGAQHTCYAGTTKILFDRKLLRTICNGTTHLEHTVESTLNQSRLPADSLLNYMNICCLHKQYILGAN